MSLNKHDSDIELQIYTEQIENLYTNGPVSFVFSVLNGLILAFLQRSVIPHQILWSWFVVLLLVTLTRAILLYCYRHKKSNGFPVKYWHWAYLAGSTLSGSVWGSAAIFLFPNNDPGHQLFVVFVLAGMTAGAMSVLAACMISFLLFALPVLLPLALQIHLLDNALSTPMAVMILFYLIGITLSARSMNKTILTSLRLRFSNRELINEIQQRQSTEEALHLEKERLQITFSAMADGVMITTVDGVVEYLNHVAENMSGIFNTDANGKKIDEIFSHFDEDTGQSIPNAIYECLKNNNQINKNSLLITKDGVQRVIEEVATPLKDRAGAVIGAVAILRDVTQANEHSRQLAFQASHDGLTGLPNRALLCDRLEHAIEKAIRGNTLVAVLYMDLNDFKQINDRLGHATGDLLLRNVAIRLTANIREQDTVARLGGDEFVVVLEDLNYQDQASVVAEKIVEGLAKTSTIEGQLISVMVSIGITVFPRDGRNVETLLKNADTAMYQAKEHSNKNVQFYTSEMSVQIDHRLKLEQQLHQALARNELELHFQPRVDMNNLEISGLEALLRWRTSSNKLLEPIEFIQIAEESGSIIEIGAWSLHNACQQAQSWNKEMDLPLPLPIAVNLSVRQILSPNIVNMVETAIKDSGLNPHLLEIEINESLFLDNAEHAIMVLNQLKSLGIKLAIDDFGIGYSTLSYIKKFPVDILKIDRSFIHDISAKPSDSSVLPAIITMGHDLNLAVVAEGVENELQYNHLKTLGCNSFLGYYFSKPLPANDITNMLRIKQFSSQVL